MHFDRSQKPYINPIRTNYSAFWNYWLTLLHIFSAIGSSFRKKSKKKKITQGSSFCKKSRKEKITQGSKFGEPRKEIVPQGSKFGEPRKEIVPQGLSIRKKPREEIISPVNIFTHFLEGCQSHEEPEKEIITQSNGFKPGEEMKKEVTGEGSMFGEPRKEIVPQGNNNATFYFLAYELLHIFLSTVIAYMGLIPRLIPSEGLNRNNYP
ncbi:uncharacterized protein LOC118199724, partial [Stegodyphus dumicola]|uniref:uncharacterized protein LOC118199724 n=1 Tax=Stegodyphus dumicola TaxID=202533 RepID=UPI0015AC685D